MFAIIGWIGRVLLILFIVRLVISMFGGGKRTSVPGTGGTRATGSTGGTRGEKSVAKLVRDPQCGTYVAENTAIAARHGGETLHFCSERCRDEFLAAPRATAV